MKSLSLCVSILFLMAVTTVSAQRKKNAVDKFLDNICEKCNYCKIDPKCDGCEKCSQCTSRSQVVIFLLYIYVKLTLLYFRVAADSARLGRTLLHARRDAGRAADYVRVLRAAMIGKDKYLSWDSMCTIHIHVYNFSSKAL